MLEVHGDSRGPVQFFAAEEISMNSSEKERRNRIADMVLDKFLDRIVDEICKGKLLGNQVKETVEGTITICYGIADMQIAAGNETVSDDGSDA